MTVKPVKDTEELCQELGINYDKFAKWANYELARCKDKKEKYILNQIYTLYSLNLLENTINSSSSKLAEHNAREIKDIEDSIS